MGRLREAYGLDEASAGGWVLVVRTEGAVYGPFASEQETEQAARTLYGDPEAFDHADTNNDFFVTELLAPDAIARDAMK